MGSQICEAHESMRGIYRVGTLQSEYADLVEDVMRIAAMHAAIHFMLVLENKEPFLNSRVVALFLYSALGLAMYHLIIKRLVHLDRKPEQIEQKIAST